MTGDAGYVLFHIDASVRQSLITDHKFYVDQAKKRLLSQFDDISGEADQFAETWLKEHDRFFDPDRHDPGDFEDQAYQESIGFYRLLTGMHDTTRLSVVAGMFHEWDKQLREWLSRALAHSHPRSAVQAAIWKANFDQIVELLGCLSWAVRESELFSELDACRLVVNVYKHGMGNSFDTLKDRYPQFLRGSVGDAVPAEWLNRYTDHTYLKVSDEDVEKFSSAIIAFWEGVPEKVYQSQITGTPKWLEKALSAGAG